MFYAITRTLTVQEWEDFCYYSNKRTDTELAASARLREAILALLMQTDNDLFTQHTATEFALRRRRHEYQMMLDELNWQKAQVSVCLRPFSFNHAIGPRPILAELNDARFTRHK